MVAVIGSWRWWYSCVCGDHPTETRFGDTAIPIFPTPCHRRPLPLPHHHVPSPVALMSTKGMTTTTIMVRRVTTKQDQESWSSPYRATIPPREHRTGACVPRLHWRHRHQHATGMMSRQGHTWQRKKKGMMCDEIGGEKQGLVVVPLSWPRMDDHGHEHHLVFAGTLFDPP